MTNDRYEGMRKVTSEILEAIKLKFDLKPEREDQLSFLQNIQRKSKLEVSGLDKERFYT